MLALNPTPKIPKLSRALLLAAVLILFAVNFSALAQGTFHNLNFESANIPNGTSVGSMVPISSGLPGWNATLSSTSSGTTSLSQVYYDGFSLGGALVSINDANTGDGRNPLQGTYSADLFGGGPFGDTSASINQTGLVPIGTKSLLVDAFGAPFITSIGGQQITMVPLQTFSTYILYGGDISAFAGTTSQLSFTEPPPVGTPPSVLILDNIIFSPNPIPEPGAGSLFLCGAGLLGAIRYARSKSNS